MSFDGVDDSVQFNSPVTNNAPFSIELWVKSTSSNPSTHQGIIANGGETGNSYGFILSTDTRWNGWYFGVRDTRSQYGGSATASPISVEWTHLVGVWDGTPNPNSIKLYVNGDLAGSTTPGSHSLGAGTANDLVIGTISEIPRKYFFSGIIDEVRIYNRALSADEIKAHYETPGASAPVATFAPTPAPSTSVTTPTSSPLSAFTPQPEEEGDGSFVSPVFLIGAAVLVVLLIAGIGLSRIRGKGGKSESTKPQPPVEPTKPPAEPPKPKAEAKPPEPKVKVTKPEPEKPSSVTAREQKVTASSAVNYNRTTILYKVKVENKLSKPISDIKIKAYVPDVFLAKEDEKTIAMLEPNNARTVTFEIRPTGECGDCNVSGRVTYYNHLIDKREEVEIPVKSVSIICPLLKAREITEEAWRNLVSNLIEAGESTKDEIPLAAKSRFNMTSEIVKDLNLYKVSESVTEDAHFFRGVARFYGEGIKELKYAAQIEAIGGAKKSQLILKTWAEREDALTGFYFKILDEIEKRIKVKGYIDDTIVQQFYHIGDRIGTVVKDSVVQRSTIGGGAEAGKKCPRCGRAVSDDEKFCPACGSKLD